MINQLEEELLAVTISISTLNKRLESKETYNVMEKEHLTELLSMMESGRDRILEELGVKEREKKPLKEQD